MRMTASFHFLTTGLLAVTLSVTTSLQAAETDKAIEPADNGWKGALELGISNTTGNVETKSANVGLQLNRETLPWRYRVAAKASSMDALGTRVSEDYLLDLQADYVLPNKNYWFGYAGYDSNKFASIDSRYVEIFGYGMNVVDTPKQKLDMELGLGGRQSTFTGTLGDEKGAIGHIGVEYSLQLTDNTKFTENLVVQPGSANTFTMSDTALEVGMSKNTSLKLGYSYTNNSDVFPGIKKTDATTSANIVIGF
ncbi:DUF481 domain-containing protein [Thiothrix litoralis]|jgi:putative salt-induced outer membrane protein|uniref:DUF481 domain-containing protein n=1 Tax=Thiothrix litoralis TaxID=2891210 RepID=A0ABX7WYA4_9GAMM|nr:DUF481 domain-containing protein [Thiothrix litoralis]QTR46604.1 DUF481 domain-containing protein [Thiothrix litoralis]